MFETGVIYKIIVDLGITQHLIANCELIRDYYNNYSEYKTRSGEVLTSYRKDTLFMPLDNSFLKSTNVWYTPDLGFKLISTIQLGKKEIEMWLQTTNQPSQILHNRVISGYVDPINEQYVFWLKKTLKSPAIANLADIQPKKRSNQEILNSDTHVWDIWAIEA